MHNRYTTTENTMQRLAITRPLTALLAAATITATLPAQAAEWVEIDASGVVDKETRYADYDSLQQHSFGYGSGNYYTIWLKTTYPKAQKLADGKLYREAKSYYYIDCQNKRLISDAVHYYTSTGNTVDSVSQYVSTSSSSNWSRAIPDSVGDGIVNSVCKLANIKFGPL
ncbi:surface-adhesin E family protein [Moraxella sp. ZJ142]|uniref:surface-adhesin E family protein n=1 Tax=Moraxella marmotae TaxID=3344520 RepID=UPI0035D42049